MNKMLLVFDVDGVLEKEEKIDRERKEMQFKAIAEKFKISEKEAEQRYLEIKEKMPKGKRYTSAYTFMEFGFTRKEFFKLIDKVNPTGLIERHDHCEKVLKKLGKNNKLMAYSNTSRKATIKSLKLLRIKKYFSKIYSAEEFEESKPSEDNLKRIMKENGFEAERTLVIGNSLEKDILPAHELGIKTILFDPYKKYKKAKEADAIIKDLIEVLKVVL